MRDVLVLNTTYEYLQIVDIQKAIRLLVKGKAEVIEPTDDGKTFRVRHKQENGTFDDTVLFWPSVIRLLNKVNFKNKPVAFTRRRVLMRDNFTCQYCGKTGVKMTIDHVHPQSLGGKSTWENCVAACVSCNKKKSNKTYAECGMRLRKEPRQPSFFQFIRLSPALNNPKVKERWGAYLYQQ